MWPILLNLMRSNAVYITLPIAAVIGFIGYNVESLVSDKYTPYSNSIQENRVDRLTEEVTLENATNVDRQKATQNILDRNLSPSLLKHKN